MAAEDITFGAAYLCALGTLTDAQRLVLHLRFREGLSLSETAARLGCTVTNVCWHQKRALARLRDDLAPYAQAA